MLVRFIVSNFMSFKEETEFNMLPASGQKRLKEHIHNAGGVDVLKMAAIYGANGAGKSNLVKAMKTLKDIVRISDFSGIRKFKLDKKCLLKPTTFEIEFSMGASLYSYGLAINNNSISKEWFYKTGTNESLIFERNTVNGKTDIIMSEEHLVSPEDKLRVKLYETELLKDNVTLLKMLAESKDPIKEFEDAYDFFYFGYRILGTKDVSFGLTGFLHKYPLVNKFVNENICSSNTGISSLRLNSTSLDSFFGKDNIKEIEEIKNKINESKDGVFISSNARYVPFAVKEDGKIVVKEISSYHKDIEGNEVKFNLDEESDGTLRLLDLLREIEFTIRIGFTIIIDEIEQSIHVNLLKELISKFSQNSSAKGQLIFTTHESNLLDQDILRQDEIWFAEKNPACETGFYPLSDYEIRSDLDIRKGYLNGRFGAIPFLANLHDLNWDKYGKDEA